MMLDKGKGPILGKLRIIQLIEADLQLIIRIFLGSRNKKAIEGDKRILKYNYGLRQGYSIEEVILEKRLIYDISRMNKELTAYIITDLEVYCDR